LGAADNSGVNEEIPVLWKTRSCTDEQECSAGVPRIEQIYHLRGSSEVLKIAAIESFQ
jgi:hypothetical protein